MLHFRSSRVATPMLRYIVHSKNNVTVFFDGGCPLCSKEINHYKRIQNKYQIKELAWHDISKGDLGLLEKRVSWSDAMTEMHAVIHDEEKVFIIQNGIDAFLRIWERLPYYRFIPVIVKLIPGSKVILNKLYHKWVLYRLRTDPRLATCDAERCKPKI
jgi:predicted DCC family thiol-disulfide oxidoreductase YuxK